MKVRSYNEVKLKVTMPGGDIILDSGPLDVVCDNFEAGFPASCDTDDAALSIRDELDKGTPGAKVEFITDDSEWELLCMRTDDPEDNVYWR